MSAQRVAGLTGSPMANLVDDGWAIFAAPAGERDLASQDIWALSLERSLKRREQAAARGLQLPKTATGKVSAALVTATLMAPVAESGVASAQGSTVSTTATPGAPSTGMARSGSSGASVAAIQRALGITADGTFGPGTAQAVRAYQAAHGLQVDGIVGPITSGSLGLGLGGGSATATSSTAGGNGPGVSVTTMVQRKLGLTADGIYGPLTRAAVRSFQASHGLIVDGIVGPRTLAALAGNGNTTSSTTPTSNRGPKPSPGVTTAIQTKLGLAADGVFGPRTRAAVRSFQAAHGLTVDGVVGPATLSAMGVSGAPSSSTQNAAAPVSAVSQGGSGAVAAARSQIGTPYASAGTAPGGFDCSGLTQWAFRRAGISLPRTSYAQFGVGAPVSRANVQAGDLVFFNTDGGGASHVGIATSNGTVISATSHGVMEHSITDSYWGSHYVGARRV